MKTGKKPKQSFSLSNRGSESVKSFANKQERNFAKEIGGKTTPASGGTPHIKGDVLNTSKMFDLKSAKTSNQIIVTEKMLKKLLDDAMRVGRDPVLVLDFPNSELRYKKWVLIPKEDFDA